MRTILGQDDAGEFKVDIPDNARLTYGPNAPFSKKKEGSYSAGKDGWSLRVYTGEQLIACLTCVKWFRESSLVKLSRLIEKVATEEVWKNDEGGYEHKSIVSRSKQLRSHSDEGQGFVDVKPATSKGKK